jgi:hypothetical protein
MSTEDENSERNAQSLLVDYFVILNKTWAMFGSSLAVSVLIILAFIMAMTGDPALTWLGTALVIGAGLAMVIPLALTVLWLWNKRKSRRNVLEVHSSFVRRSYITTFELIPFEGEKQIDRLCNHLSLVFPEVQTVKEKNDKKGKKFSDLRKKKTHFEDYDLAFQTDTGIFIIKIFTRNLPKIVKFDDIEKIIKHLNGKQVPLKLFAENPIMRVVCLADNYDPFFETEDFLLKMKETKRNYYKIDLILQREFGYSTIWIDR